MLIVKSVAVPYGNDVIKFASGRAKAPHISVPIGPNGSRKSLILRNIVLSGAEHGAEQMTSSVRLSSRQAQRRSLQSLQRPQIASLPTALTVNRCTKSASPAGMLLPRQPAGISSRLPMAQGIWWTKVSAR